MPSYRPQACPEALPESKGQVPVSQRDASLFLHRDATVDISRFKVETAGKYAGPEN